MVIARANVVIGGQWLEILRENSMDLEENYLIWKGGKEIVI